MISSRTALDESVRKHSDCTLNKLREMRVEPNATPLHQIRGRVNEFYSDRLCCHDMFPAVR